MNTDPKGSASDGRSPAVIVLASLNKKIRVIKISEEPRALRVYNAIFGILRRMLICSSPSILQEAQFLSDVTLLLV